MTNMEKWREEFEARFGGLNLLKTLTGEYEDRTVRLTWIGYLAGRQAAEVEIDSLKTRPEYIIARELKDNTEALEALGDLIYYYDIKKTKEIVIIKKALRGV